MKATYAPNASPYALKTSHRRESATFQGWKLIDLDAEPYGSDKAMPCVLDIRVYWTSARHYCCIWLVHAGGHRNASGVAQGFGYHRGSAAVSDAIKNLGFKLSEDIDGRGYDSCTSAFRAIAEALGIKRPAIVTIHP